jgi:hypothetical protein
MIKFDRNMSELQLIVCKKYRTFNISEFYILLTVHPEAIVGFQPT